MGTFFSLGGENILLLILLYFHLILLCLLPCMCCTYLLTVLFKVYCPDHTYTTIRVSVSASVSEVISAVADKLGSAEDLLLVSLSSAGGENAGSHVLIK